jgi:two-component system, cell cycle response regulator DivK
MARILLVEDDQDNRDLVRMTLELDGHEVIEAGSAEEGLPQACAHAPDLILMDLSLQGAFDGLEATRRLRSEARFDHTPIIALTAHAFPGDRERALAAGCDEHWTKPIVDLTAFREMVLQVIAGGRQNGNRPPPG